MTKKFFFKDYLYFSRIYSFYRIVIGHFNMYFIHVQYVIKFWILKFFNYYYTIYLAEKMQTTKLN